MSKASLLHKLLSQKQRKHRPWKVAVHEVLRGTIMLSLIPGIHIKAGHSGTHLSSRHCGGGNRRASMVCWPPSWEQ